MSDEVTGRLNDGGSFEARMLEQFALLREGVNSLGHRLSGVEARLSTLEEKVDARLRETRPNWEAVLSRLDKIETRLDRMEVKMDVFTRDVAEARTDVEMLKRRPPAA